MIVTDATALIALAKMGRLHLVREVYGEVAIGPVVGSEVVEQGKRVGAPEVVYVEKAVMEGWVKIVRLSTRERRAMQSLINTSRLDDGEAESMAIARSRRCMMVIDDKEARTLAQAMGITHVGTAGVLLDAYADGNLKLHELEDAVQDLSKVLWLSPAVAIEVLRKARGMKK